MRTRRTPSVDRATRCHHPTGLRELPPGKLKLHLGYTVVPIGYMTGIFILSELPGAAGGPLGRVPEFHSNLFHIPLFTGFAWCLLMSLSGGQWSQAVSGRLYGLIGLLAGAYAALGTHHTRCKEWRLQ